MSKILCVGPQWRGSNAGGLFRALARIGQLISVIDENYFINLSNRSLISKAISRVIRPFQIKEFNKAIISEASSFKPDYVLIYKGAFLLPETIHELKGRNITMVNFYPDVSFHTHGSLLARTLPLYQHVFSTKTFGVEDMRTQLGVKNATFIPHGFDPDIHRAIDLSSLNTSYFECDVSFIGGWSAKKEHYLEVLKSALPNLNLKIWGGRWNNCHSNILVPSIQNTSILGDLYSIAIQSSKINLGLLHEKVVGASSGDLITSRTFHIPGAGGFMLHERTSEVALYFEEDKEIACFDSPKELVDKVSFYLNNPFERDFICKQGHTRSIKEHSLDQRAFKLVEELQLMKLV